MVKTLTITQEAYERLAAKKAPGQSFSEAIMDLTGKASLLDLVGILSKDEASDIRKHIRERRNEMRNRMKNTRRGLE